MCVQSRPKLYQTKLIDHCLYLGNEDSNRRVQEPNSQHQNWCLLQAFFDWEFMIRICQHLDLDGPTLQELIRYWDQRCNELLSYRQLVLEDEIGYRDDKAEMIEWQKKHDKWHFRKIKRAVISVVVSQFNQRSKITSLRSQMWPHVHLNPNEE